MPKPRGAAERDPLLDVLNDQDAGPEDDTLDTRADAPEGDEDEQPEGDEDEQPEDGEDEQPEDGEDEQPERPQGRRDRRIASYQKREREAVERAETLQRQLDTLSRQPPAQQQQPQRETPEQRAVRWATMTPEERMQEQLTETTTVHRREMAQLQHTLMDTSDRTAYASKAASNPVYQKWESKVEAKRQELLQQGMNAPREAVLKFLIGEAALEQYGKGNRTQRRAGAKRVERERTQPSTGRGDVGSDRRQVRDERASRERRLENVEL